MNLHAIPGKNLKRPGGVFRPAQFFVEILQPKTCMKTLQQYASTFRIAFEKVDVGLDRAVPQDSCGRNAGGSAPNYGNRRSAHLSFPISILEFGPLKVTSL